MQIEAFIVGIVLAAALLPLFVLRRMGLLHALIAAGIGVAILTVVLNAAAWPAPTAVPEAAIVNRPIQIPEDGAVLSQSCRSCHPHEYHTWHSSYHRTMTQIASAESVAGDFDDVVIDYRGRRTQLSTNDDQFWIEMEDPAWTDPYQLPPRIKRQIVMTTGSHHMQVYWYPMGEGRALGQVPFIYLFDDAPLARGETVPGRWIPRLSAFLTPPNQTVDEGGRWNTGCIKCHTTLGQPRRDETGIFDTQVTEFGITCQACHGEGEAHIRANRNPGRRYGLHLTGRADSTVVQPQRLDEHRMSQVCGQCHGITTYKTFDDAAAWLQNGWTYRAGDDLDDSRLLVGYNANLEEPVVQHLIQRTANYLDSSFWSDGMVRVSGREYNGLVESPCFTHGDSQKGIMSCLSCHQMHKPAHDPRPMRDWADDQLQLGMRSNQACTQCHPGFETAEKIETHTFHPADSAGSECMNCHMPYTTYGVLKAIRSHTVSSPSVQESLETGRPNACNQCHLDQTLSWTASHLASRYGMESPQLSDEHQSTAASILWALKGDAGQRALMAWSMGWDDAIETSGRDWTGPILAQLLDDPYDAVRFIAERSLRRQLEFEEFDYDFVTPRNERAAVRGSVWEIWRRHLSEGSNPDPSTLLLRDDGSIDVERFEALLQQRDDRPVNLLE